MLTMQELELIATFVAGRVASKEVELGDLSFKSEDNEQKLLRVDYALTALVDYLNRHLPDSLPTEIRKICAEAKKNVSFDLN